MAKKNKKKDKVRKADKEKIKLLIDKIKEGYAECGNIETTAAEKAIQLGNYLLELKKLVRKKKGTKWEEYLPENIPLLPLRTAQRFMRMAKSVDDLEEHTAIAHLGNVRIYELTRRIKKDQKLNEVLEEAGIELDIDLKSRKEIAKFKFNVDEFLDSTRKQSKGDGARAKKKTRKTKRTAKHFTAAVSGLREYIDEIIEKDDKNSLEETSVEEIDELMEKLAAIRKLLASSKKRAKKKK